MSIIRNILNSTVPLVNNSLPTTGSNIFVGNQTITGSLSVVSITGSLAYSNLTSTPTLVSGSDQIISILNPLNSYSASNTANVSNLHSYTSSLNNAIQLTGSTVSFLGNIVVYGTQSIINSTNLEVSDNMIYLAPSNPSDIDLGIVGHYNDGTYRHSGIFRDASDSGTWKVFKDLTAETSGTVDTAHASFALADFKAGVFTGTSFNGIVNSTNGVVSGSSQVIDILGSLNIYTGSVETRFTTLASLTGSNGVRLSNLESTTASLNAWSSSLTSSLTASYTTINQYNSLTQSFNIISGSVVTLNSGFDTGSYKTFTASVNTSISNLNNATSSYETKGRSIVSGSSQITPLLPSGVVSGSSQVSLASTTGFGTYLNQAVLTTSSPTFASVTGTVTASGNGDSNAPFKFSQDYSGWMSIVAGSPGSANGWGLYWAGESGTLYGTNQAGAVGNIWSNSSNPNEYAFVGNGVTVFSIHGNTGNWWSKGNGRVGGTLTVDSTATVNGSTVRTDANTSYSTTFTSVSSVSVTHNLGTKNVMVMCYGSDDAMFWPASIVTTSTNVVDITFTTSRTGRVVIIR